ncbi:18494_t:CDS:2 [Gigaspora margarita]|uniref:18494_t:CDS:1 n=1 Tax=Gigaspora margarita TaxID=4874 RepID=A0ABN7UPW0_GIGMA|nr:18494_t:CDS:2 [Gigaspora margarita]
MEIDNIGINMNNMEEQIQVTIECPNKEEYQVTMDSSPDTNGTEVEMFTQQKMTCNPRNADARGNEDLRNELNTLSFTNNIAAQSNEHVESHTLEIAIKTIQLEDAK